MSCNKQHVAAAVCGFIEDVSGDKVTQADWHGLVRRAEEKGYAVGRKRLDIRSGLSALRGLGISEGNAEALRTAYAKISGNVPVGASVAIVAVNGKYPTYTQNMAAVVALLTNDGVKSSLDKVRESRKGSDWLGSGKNLAGFITNNSDIPTDVLASLATNEDADVRGGVAQNPNTLADTLVILAADEDENVRERVALHQNTPADTLAVLAADEYEDVRERVAYNSNTPADTLAILAVDDNLGVRHGVWANRNSPAPAVSILAILEEDEFIMAERKKAVERWDYRPKTWSETSL